MEVKAAVAHKAGEPLRIEKVNLEGPKASISNQTRRKLL